MDELKQLTRDMIVTMRENTAEVAQLRGKQDQVLAEHKALRGEVAKRKKWSRRGVVVLLVFLALYLWSDHLHNAHENKIRNQQTSDLVCIALHEDAQDSRSTVLAAKSNARNQALRAMVDAQFKALTYARSAHPAQSTVIHLIDVWNSKTEAFRTADNAYTRAVIDNPVPQLQFTCSDRLRGTKQGAPLPTVTATATATTTAPGSTASLTVPGPTATSTTVMRMPGPTVTVVIREPGSKRTRTVTTTKTPPDCMTRPVPPCTLRVPTLPRLP